MYDSRDITPSKKLTKATILELVSESYIFRHYLGFDFKLGKAYSSPMRKDSNPSFVLYMTANGTIIFKDFNGSSGNCFDFVMYMHNSTFKEALGIIDKDLKLGISTDTGTFSPSSLRNEYVVEKLPQERKLIQFKPRIFTANDGKYWTPYGITCLCLKKFEVYAASFIFLDKKLILRESYGNPIYCYRFPSKAIKVYRPLSSEIKWLSNTSEEDIQGAAQLPQEIFPELIITKSLKDVMVLDSLGYNSIAPQSENTKTQYEKIGVLIREHQIKTVTVLFDPDPSGINGAEELQQYLKTLFPEMSLSKAFIEEKGCKDISDLRKIKGEHSAVEFLKTLKCQN